MGKHEEPKRTRFIYTYKENYVASIRHGIIGHQVEVSDAPPSNAADQEFLLGVSRRYIITGPFIQTSKQFYDRESRDFCRMNTNTRQLEPRGCEWRFRFKPVIQETELKYGLLWTDAAIVAGVDPYLFSGDLRYVEITDTQYRALRETLIKINSTDDYMADRRIALASASATPDVWDYFESEQFFGDLQAVDYSRERYEALRTQELINRGQLYDNETDERFEGSICIPAVSSPIESAGRSEESANHHSNDVDKFHADVLAESYELAVQTMNSCIDTFVRTSRFALNHVDMVAQTTRWIYERGEQEPFSDLLKELEKWKNLILAASKIKVE